MRRLISIFLILLIFLNACGYYGVFVGLQYWNDLSMSRKLDAEKYEAAETISLHIPITVPYGVDSREFVRVDGKFEAGGEFYRLVKQRFSKDTLHVVYVKDHDDKRIHDVIVEYATTFSDSQGDEQQNPKAPSGFGKDFIGRSFSLAMRSLGWSDDVIRQGRVPFLVPSFLSSIVHPPERA